MLSNYIVRTERQELFSFYYTKEKGISYRTYENGKWGREQTLFSTARDNFTVSLGYDGGIYLFCQDFTGDIVLCSRTDGGFRPQPILKNQSSKIHTIQLSPIITAKGISLIYNLPEENSSYIVLQQSLDGRAAWSAPSRIDKFWNLPDCMFHMQQVQGEHHIMFYLTRTPENNLGYREITPARQGSYHVFHTTGYSIDDYSFLCADDAIHVLYTVKSMFSSQLIYRKKESGQFSNPVVVCEGQKLENCLLFFASGKLYASFMNGTHLYICVSDNGGISFSRPQRYKNKFCVNPVKAVYVSGTEMSERNFFARQVYIDRNNPHDVQLLPDLCDEFYPVLPPPEAKPAVSEEYVDTLRDRLDTMQRQNEEKDRQIAFLTEMLQKRNEME